MTEQQEKNTAFSQIEIAAMPVFYPDPCKPRDKDRKLLAVTPPRNMEAVCRLAESIFAKANQDLVELGAASDDLNRADQIRACSIGMIGALLAFAYSSISFDGRESIVEFVMDHLPVAKFLAERETP